MNKYITLTIILLLALLVACESKTTGKRVAAPDIGPTGGVAVFNIQETTSGETGKTAAEALKELQQTETGTPVDGAKSGNFYPPITTTATGQDALKEKTRALFQQAVYDPNVEADTESGSRYYDSDGDSTNLPDEYGGNNDD